MHQRVLFQGMLVVVLACSSQIHMMAAQWDLCTAEAVSRFFEHVRNAASLKKITIFVCILSAVSYYCKLTQPQGERRRSHDRVHSKRAHLVSYHFSSSLFFFLSLPDIFCVLNIVTAG